MTQVSDAERKSSITVDKATRLMVLAVQADMQRAARQDLTLGEVVARLADGWQRRNAIVNGTAGQGRPSPCGGCNGGCGDSITRAWRFIGATLGLALIAATLAGAAWIRAGA